MTCQCASCGARLRVPEQTLKSGRSAAPCPRCGTSVALQAAPESNGSDNGAAVGQSIVVACDACGARLRAPAARAGSKSRCPRCKAEIQVVPTAVSAAAEARPSATTLEEPSNAVTRRIDSRALGIMHMAAAPGSTLAPEMARPIVNTANRGAVSAPEAPPARSAEMPETGLAQALMNPPVKQMTEIADGIREVAEELGRRPEKAVTAPAASAPAVAASPAPRQEPHATDRPAAPAVHPHRVTPSREIRRFPASRGLFMGGIAGLLAGGCVAGAQMWALLPASAWFEAPLPLPLGFAGITAAAMRAAVLCVLGAVVGFLAAALGSPSVNDSPLSLLRCGATSLLVGAAAGLITALMVDSGLQIWPVAGWMRDLLLVGLLTPLLNRMVPSAHR
ncbi:MAG TPA: hypothetical protein VFG76_06060 [Candidatus Polarisedimenticolia bacterium]|nr:hypothetical protein [Candidatus Polarisedimenticolia bacterium]